jgi:hypothetical protein
MHAQGDTSSVLANVAREKELEAALWHSVSGEQLAEANNTRKKLCA